MIEHLVKPEDTIIIELNRHQIELIAATTHLFLYYHPDNMIAKSLLRSLIEQTNYVYSDPEKHGLLIRLKNKPVITTSEQYGVLASDMDISNLDHLFYTE